MSDSDQQNWISSISWNRLNILMKKILWWSLTSLMKLNLAMLAIIAITYNLSKCHLFGGDYSVHRQYLVIWYVDLWPVVLHRGALEESAMKKTITNKMLSFSRIRFRGNVIRNEIHITNCLPRWWSKSGGFTSACLNYLMNVAYVQQNEVNIKPLQSSQGTSRHFKLTRHLQRIEHGYKTIHHE